MNVFSILGLIMASLILGVLICLLVLLILDSQLKDIQKKQRQVNDIEWHYRHGTPMEEILKMPMPKKLKRKLLKIYKSDR